MKRHINIFRSLVVSIGEGRVALEIRVSHTGIAAKNGAEKRAVGEEAGEAAAGGRAGETRAIKTGDRQGNGDGRRIERRGSDERRKKQMTGKQNRLGEKHDSVLVDKSFVRFEGYAEKKTRQDVRRRAPDAGKRSNRSGERRRGDQE